MAEKKYNRDSRELVLAKEQYANYFDNYNSIREFNKKNSEHFEYFEVFKRILTNSLSDNSIKKKNFENLDDLNESKLLKTIEEPHVQDLTGIYGRNWPKKALTMIGLMRLENLQFCVEETIRNNILGDLIETGVWRGGATIFIKLILKKYGIKDKLVFVADSFEGLPKPNVDRFPEDEGDDLFTYDALKISLDEVKKNFQIYGALDDQVKFIKGFFEDTMKNITTNNFSLIRLDGDMYGSTWSVLENLYEKLSSGGYLIVDDYRLGACKKAIHDFRKLKNIQEPIIPIDGSGVYWKKE